MSLGLLYLFIVVLPNASIAMEIIATILIVASMASFIAGVECFNGEKASPRYALGKKLALWAFVLIMLSIPCPSERQLYKIAGGYVATNTRDVAKLPDNLVKAANAWLEKVAESADDKKTSNQK